MASPTTNELNELLTFLTPDERAEMDRLLNDVCLWAPIVGSPQFDAYYSLADELFYGGAAGGGKSELILGLAATQHKRSIIYRREYPQLRGLIERSREIIPEALGSFNATSGVWHLNDGRVIEFGAVQYAKDVSKYQGRPHDLVAFDELPNFLEQQYRFLNGWKRTDDPAQRTRTIGAGNPPLNAEGRWVIKYWAPWLDDTHPNPARPGELRWYAVIDGEDVEVDGPGEIEHNDEIILPKSRTFIPARVEDNPYYMATGYKAQLQAMPEPLRSQLLLGLFNVAVEDDPWQVIPTAWVLLAQERWRNSRAPMEIMTPMNGMGVDVARGGGDQTVIARRYDNWFAPLLRYPGESTPDGPKVAQLVINAMRDKVRPNVDVIGVGSSVYDFLRANHVDCVGVNVAERSEARDKANQLGFVNKRAELYWKMREALDPANGHEIALPDDAELRADLCAPHWTVTPRGVQIESKDDIKKRLGRSTDSSDAVVLALYYRPKGVGFA